MRARLTALVIVLTFSFAGSAFAEQTALPSSSIALDDSHTISISSPEGTVFDVSRASGPTQYGTTEERYRYAVGSRRRPAADVWITVRELATGSHMVFARMTSHGKPVFVKVTLTGPAEHYYKHDLELQPKLKPDKHLGVDRTSGPYGWVTLTTASGVFDRNVFLSKAHRFRPLEKRYGRNGTSKIKALVSERTLLTTGRLADGKVHVTFGLSAAGDSCERYFLVAPYSMVDSRTSAKRIARVVDENVRWLDPDGPLRKSSYSTEPTTRIGYAHSLLLMRTDDFRIAYEKTGSPFFEDLMLNNIYSLGLIRDEDGLWRTDYTSLWVKRESGITAPYVDTRHNEGIALAMRKTADALDAKHVTCADDIRDWASPFASFLVKRAAAGAVLRTGNGYYFADYYDASGIAKCHVSLNHALGEMNYLLKLCEDTTDTATFEVAMNIKAAVDDCGTEWIASNKDLHYERTLHGRYKGTDYPTVTYHDLLNSQRLLTELTGQRDPVFDELITSKEEFLGKEPSVPSVTRVVRTKQAETPDRYLDLRNVTIPFAMPSASFF